MYNTITFNLFYYFRMKNTLQLEIVTKIKKANQLYSRNELTQSLQLYDEALDVFKDNLKYNSSVSHHFQGVIRSLKGLAYLGLKQYEKAQNQFQVALQINPHDVLTLVRRATLFYQVNRLSEAIQDCQKAYVCDPQGKSLTQVVDLLNKAIYNLEDQYQKSRLKQNFESIKFITAQTAAQELDQEEHLSFTNLKNIDKVSQPDSSRNSKNEECESNTQNGKQSTQKNKSRFAKGQNYQNPGHSVEYSQQVSIIENSKKTKKCPKFRSININFENQFDSKETQHNLQRFSSIENIGSNKLQRRSSVTFLQNVATSGQAVISQQSLCVPTVRSSNVKRKSCLRNSKVSPSQVQAKQERGTTKKRSTFLNIQNIDGLILKSTAKDEVSEDKQQKASESDQDDNSEHNIFGNIQQETKMLRCLQNLRDLSQNTDPNLKGKKGSILKKNSVISSYKDTKNSWKSQTKKSVCFQDENKPKFIN